MISAAWEGVYSVWAAMGPIPRTPESPDLDDKMSLSEDVFEDIGSAQVSAPGASNEVPLSSSIGSIGKASHCKRGREG